MNTATFIENIVFDFPGNVSQNAITFGDVDNDGESELVLGNSGGELVIFKGGSTSKYWKKCQNLGHITAVRVGPLLNNNLNVLLAISIDGWCYVFSFFEVESEEACDNESLDEVNGDEVEDEDSELESNKSDNDGISVSTFGENKHPSTESCRMKEDEDVLKYIYKQRIPANVKEIVLDDVDGDGKVELLIVLTDRVIRTYKWEFIDKPNGYKLKGRLQSLNKWDFAGQIGSVALHNIEEGFPNILVTQPGGSCMKINCGKDTNESSGYDLKNILLEDNEPKHSIRNLNVSSEIIGNFGPYYALATLDGSIIVMDNGKMIKKIKLNHQVFCLNRLALSLNGPEELIVSSWDGHTYIISQDYRILEFHFGENIAAFKTGHYTLNGRLVPAFAFVTFTDKVYLYHDIDLSKGIGLKSCFDSPSECEEIEKLLSNRVGNADLSEIFTYLAYGTFKATQTINKS